MFLYDFLIGNKTEMKVFGILYFNLISFTSNKRTYALFALSYSKEWNYVSWARIFRLVRCTVHNASNLIGLSTVHQIEFEIHN